MSHSNILGVGLTTKTYDYITPLGKKLQYFSNEICRICPFMTSKYGIANKNESIECYNPKLLDDVYNNLEELMLIHTDYWGNDNALNCKDLLSDWKAFKEHINNKYYEEFGILSIIKTDVSDTDTFGNLTPDDQNWKRTDDNITLSSNRFTRLSIDPNDLIQKDLYKIITYPYGLAIHPPHIYIPFDKYTLYLNRETNYIIQTNEIEESIQYRYIGFLDTEISAIKIISTIWETKKQNYD